MLRLICSFELVHVDGLLPHTHIILDGDGLVSKPALDELQDLGGDVEDLLSFVLLVLNRDVRRVVSKTSHFERSYSACRIATAAEALRIEIDYLPINHLCWAILLALGRFLMETFLNSQQRDRLFIKLILNLQVVHQRAELNEAEHVLAVLLQFHLNLVYA